MTNVAHAKKSPVSETTGCACGWGIHCRCGESNRRFWDWKLVDQMREFLESGSDLARRRRKLEAMRETVAAYDQRERDTLALRKLYDVLPRQKDIELVQRITCDDHRSPWTDEQIAYWKRTPLEHVRTLRAYIVDAYEGRPLRVPREWRAAAKARQARQEAIHAERRARWKATRLAAARARRAS